MIRSQRGAVVETERSRTLISDWKKQDWVSDSVAQGAAESAPTLSTHGTAIDDGDEFLLVTLYPNGSVTDYGGGLYLYNGSNWFLVDDQTGGLGTATFVWEYVIRGWERYMWAITTVTGASGSVARKVRPA